MEKTNLLFDWSNNNAIVMLQLAFFFSVMSFIMCLVLFYKRHKDELNKMAATKFPSDGLPNIFSDLNKDIEVQEEFNKKPMSTPYQFVIKNNTDTALTCNLFGLGWNLFSKNFGSQEGITVEMSSSNVSYLFMLLQSAFKPFEVSLMRFMSKNITQLDENITITDMDANGQMCQIPLIIKNFINADGIGTTIDNENNQLGEDDYKYVDIYHAININMNANLAFTVQPNTQLIVDVYPVSKRKKGAMGQYPM